MKSWFGISNIYGANIEHFVLLVDDKTTIAMEN